MESKSERRPRAPAATRARSTTPTTRKRRARLCRRAENGSMRYSECDTLWESRACPCCLFLGNVVPNVKIAPFFVPPPGGGAPPKQPRQCNTHGIGKHASQQNFRKAAHTTHTVLFTVRRSVAPYKYLPHWSIDRERTRARARSTQRRGKACVSLIHACAGEESRECQHALQYSECDTL
jgi:hypothetical protein